MEHEQYTKEWHEEQLRLEFIKDSDTTLEELVIRYSLLSPFEVSADANRVQKEINRRKREKESSVHTGFVEHIKLLSSTAILHTAFDAGLFKQMRNAMYGSFTNSSSVTSSADVDSMTLLSRQMPSDFIATPGIYPPRSYDIEPIIHRAAVAERTIQAAWSIDLEDLEPAESRIEAQILSDRLLGQRRAAIRSAINDYDINSYYHDLPFKHAEQDIFKSATTHRSCLEEWETQKRAREIAQLQVMVDEYVGMSMTDVTVSSLRQRLVDFDISIAPIERNTGIVTLNIPKPRPESSGAYKIDWSVIKPQIKHPDTFSSVIVFPSCEDE